MGRGKAIWVFLSALTPTYLLEITECTYSISHSIWNCVLEINLKLI